MWQWLRELYELRAEYKVCKSCEVHEKMNDFLRLENQTLLQRLLNKDEPTPQARPLGSEEKPILKHGIPWRVRQQMLETESKVAARAMKNAAIPDNGIEELEKELNDAAEQREKQNAKP